MNILAVSDNQSNRIEHMIEHSPHQLRDVDVIVSCGDVRHDYLEFLVDGLNRELFFVSGNHFTTGRNCRIAEGIIRGFEFDDFPERTAAVELIAGREDLHDRLEIFRDYIIAGFGGSQWYGGHENEFQGS